MARHTWLFTAYRTGSASTVRETLLLSHDVKEGSPCILNSFSEGSLGAAGSRLIPALPNCLCLKVYLHMINPLYHLAIEISEFNMLLTTYQESLVVRNPSVLMSNIESHPLPKGRSWIYWSSHWGEVSHKLLFVWNSNVEQNSDCPLSFVFF